MALQCCIPTRAWVASSVVRLTRNGCDGMIGFRTGTEEVDHAYDAITARRKGDVNGEHVTRRVLVAGPVIANGATGKPLLNADKLASAE